MCWLFVLFYFSVQLVINFLLAFDIFHALLLLLWCCCCCCFKLSFFIFGVLFCAALSIIEGGPEGQNESVWEREREREGHQQFPPFPQNDPSNLQLTFLFVIATHFFTTLTLIIQMLRTTERERRKNKKYAKLKLQIGEGGSSSSSARRSQTQRDATQLSAAQQSAVCCQLAVCFCPLLY